MIFAPSEKNGETEEADTVFWGLFIEVLHTVDSGGYGFMHTQFIHMLFVLFIFYPYDRSIIIFIGMYF